MNEPVAGPSGAKRSKTSKQPTFKRFLTEEELERMLYESDDNLEDPTFIDQIDQASESSTDDSEDYLDDSTVTTSPSTTTSTQSSSSAPDSKILLLSNNLHSQPNILNVQWDKKENLKVFPFIRANELLVPDPGDSPMDFFNLMFDDELYDIIIEQSNQYAIELFLCKGEEHARINKWKPISKEEFKIFLGLFLHMGTIKLARIQDYWKTERLFNFCCFSDYMSRDRFLIILRCLHFAKNSGEDELKPADRLYKIRPIINYFNSKMNNIYYPDKNLAIDESMVLWRGRLQFRQYIQNKRHKYGIKLYMLTEPSGIILKFSVYTGALDDQGGKGHASKVVLNLMDNKLNVGHALFMDNFYNSYDLALDLLSKNTYTTGTLRIDRKNCPLEVKTSKLKKGETIARYANGVMIARWHDKRDVNYISTEFANEFIQYNDKRGNEKTKPLPIVQYNKSMGGIDRQDQFMAYYPCSRKTVRWYKKIGLHVMQLLLLNSYLLHKKYHATRKSFYDFRLDVIRNLLPEVIKKKIGTLHYASHCPKKPGNGGTTLRKRCRYCSSQGKRQDTIFECKTCNIGLCLEPCFQEYHELIK